MVAQRLAFIFVVVSAFCCLPGCQPGDKIIAAKHPRLNDMKRMLAAIVLPEQEGDQAKTWFFKMVGKETEIDPVVEPFQKFIASVKFSTADTPTWTLPPGWTEEEAKDKKFRHATIRTGLKDKALELTVSSLPGKASVPQNVIRWRVQLGLKGNVLGAADLEDFYRYEEVDHRLAIIVDMTGPGGDGKMAPTPEPETEPKPARVPFKYQTPKGWRQVPPPNELYILSFQAADNGETADINVSVFPGAAGGLAANVDRWRKQLGLSAMTQAESATLPDVPIGDAKGKLVDIVGTKAPPQRNRIVGAILSRPETSLFFKMMGPQGLVGRQKPAFESFLKSLILDE